MKETRMLSHVLLGILGLVMVAAGLFVMDDSTQAFSGVCIGVGSGLTGMQIAQILMKRYYNRHPQLRTNLIIERNDERSLAITYKAKAKAFDITVYVLMAFPFLLILTDAALWLTLAAVAIYLFGFCVQIYYKYKFSNEM